MKGALSNSTEIPKGLFEPNSCNKAKCITVINNIIKGSNSLYYLRAVYI